MRVATKTMYDLIKYNLSTATEEMNRASLIASSGKRINALSDDPVTRPKRCRSSQRFQILDSLGVISVWENHGCWPRKGP